jgi:hypothetical protein
MKPILLIISLAQVVFSLWPAPAKLSKGDQFAQLPENFPIILDDSLDGRSPQVALSKALKLINQ